jgi:hypothetical protein
MGGGRVIVREVTWARLWQRPFQTIASALRDPVATTIVIKDHDGGPIGVLVPWRDFRAVVWTDEQPREWAQYVAAADQAKRDRGETIQ